MNLTISGHHLEVTPALRNYVTTKLDRITRHFDQVVDIKVLLTVEKQKEKERRQRAECKIHVKGNDMFAESGKVRVDGRMVHDMYLVQVKTPSESRAPWDYYKILATIPGDEAFQPLSKSKCPLVTKP